MSIAASMLLEKTVQDKGTAECRVYQRHACELPTSCQPASVAEMRETRWAATICDISQGGVGLHLKRRYEKGSALAVELPGSAGYQSSVVFVRVVHVKRNTDGTWRLGCTFISELSDDDVFRLLSAEQELATEQPVESAEKDKTNYTNVRVEVEDRGGASFKLMFKQLNVGANNSIVPGQQLRLAGGSWSFRIEVNSLKQLGDRWNLHGILMEPNAVSDLVHVITNSRK